ncbi:MAG: VWA domain-containing protein [Muribaculaceae bacterium]|nr:VWA domain-containing protein [Muribaculaceae bacterium]MDE6332604.1 VWA domain-containing protein [Muribaculaceae bacterium]
MKQRVFNLIILDESGSMSSIERQAVDGVNETVQTIRASQKKHPEQEHIVSLVSFNSGAVKTIYDKVEADRVEDLTAKQYIPSCSTPLYDAMGNSINSLRKSVADEDAVLVTVITDGYENASTEYDGQTIRKLVETMKSKGWLFTYIGANQDVEAVAASISITNTLCFEADEDGTSEMFARECRARSRWADRLASKIEPSMMANDYFDDDDDK